MTHELTQGDALLIIDVQNGFCPGGALPSEEGNAVVPMLNEWIGAAVASGVPVHAARDWHPVGHVSFAYGRYRLRGARMRSERCRRQACTFYASPVLAQIT